MNLPTRRAWPGLGAGDTTTSPIDPAELADLQGPSAEHPPPGAGGPPSGADGDDGAKGAPDPKRRTGKAGRNLPAAIAVGVGLGGLIIVSLAVVQALFVGLETVAMLVALWELRGAVRSRGVRLPVVPLAAGTVGMLLAAYLGGTRALAIAAAIVVLVVMVWRMTGGEAGYVRDVTAAVFVTAYVPFLASFALLMLGERMGAQRVALFILLTVCNDTGGYIVGVLVGRHPMAPRISPKKSWEGLAGSLALAIGVGVAGTILMLHGRWWQGVLLGAAVVASATVGDLLESMIKRDLAIKDMGSLLPGHGGIMDRLDSLLPTAVVSWGLLALFVGT